MLSDIICHPFDADVALSSGETFLMHGVAGLFSGDLVLS
jgi:hypothetical protein